MAAIVGRMAVAWLMAVPVALGPVALGPVAFGLAAARATEPPPLSVVARAGSLAVAAELDGCTARLARDADADPFTYANDCRQNTAQRVALLMQMLQAALPEPADRAQGTTIVVASLERTFPDFARRLAQQAARSPEWHGERARRDPGFAATTALRFANTPPIFRELQEAMRPLRLAVRIAQLEAVQVAAPPQTPFADWLAERGIDQRRLLPFDATVTFRLTPL